MTWSSITILILLALYFGSALFVRWRNATLRQHFRHLATSHQLHYSALDRFGLAERTRESWLTDCKPINVHVNHVMYGRLAERRRFVYLVEFLIGGAMPQRVCRIIMAHEHADDSGAIPLDLISVEPANKSILGGFDEVLKKCNS